MISFDDRDITSENTANGVRVEQCEYVFHLLCEYRFDFNLNFYSLISHNIWVYHIIFDLFFNVVNFILHTHKRNFKRILTIPAFQSNYICFNDIFWRIAINVVILFVNTVYIYEVWLLSLKVHENKYTYWNTFFLFTYV